MKAIDTSAVQNWSGNPIYTGLTPALNYTYNGTTKIVVVTDASAVAAPDTLKNINVRVHDSNGKQVNGNIAALGGNTGNIDVSSLDPSGPEGLSITATIVTDAGKVSDGRAIRIGAAGSLGKWDKDFSAAEAMA